MDNAKITKEAPEQIFHNAKQLEKKHEWSKSIKVYENAAHAFKDCLQDADTTGPFKEELAIYYLRSRINMLLNLFRFEFEESDEFDVQRAIHKIDFYQNDRRELLEEFPHAFKRCCSVERGFFNKLEESLSKNGLKEESRQIYYLNQQLDTEILVGYCRHDFHNKRILSWFENVLKLIFRYVFFNLYLGYGVKVRNLIISTILIIFVFGLLFSGFHCIEITKLKENFNPLKGLFASIMTFIGFDFDEVAPICNFGRILVSIEGILGFITFGGIIAYIWRKMK